MKKLNIALLGLGILVIVSTASAEVTLLDQNQWKVGLSGFVELDTIYDTTRSLPEVVGNTAIAKKGTFDGDNGRTQFSIRNTRLSFNVIAPEVDGWKTRGYIETDFLGYDPSVAASGTTNSEASFYSNPTMRLRHAFLSADQNGWQVLAGQTWNLFGWQPAFVPSSVSISPLAGILYQRAERIGVSKTISGDTQSVQIATSLQKPSQRDGRIPNVDLGIKWSDNARKSGFASSNSDIKTQPMSFGLSGTYRNFTYPNSSTSTTESTSMAGLAAAADVLIPVIASDDGKDVSHTLTATGEFTIGKGYGDEFPSWTGGLAQLNTSSAAPAPNSITLDQGLGGYNNGGAFELIRLRTFNGQLQYHLNGKCFFTAGYGQLFSNNLGNFISGAGQTSSRLYDRTEAKFVNWVHDFTSQFRIAFEFDQFTTHYVADGAVNHDNRYIMATYFRF